MSDDFHRLPVSTMTDGQRARRDRLTAVVIEMVSESGPENLQMREVAERSRVALGTTYRYFASKEHLMAAAWVAWHRRLSERVLAGLPRAARRPRREHGDLCERVLVFVHREMRAFQRNPNFARLVVFLEACADPYVAETLAEVGEDNERVMLALMDGVPEETARTAHLAISATLHSCLIYWTTGRMTVLQAMRNLEAVTRLVLRDLD